ncbi:MAG: helix-turn-helix transcriptional regulator [Clostridia bacterium]|nr:helix-turn-helix transcriptional regulator [Clostridia bacterium]
MLPIAKKIRTLRKEHAITQEELAAALNVTFQSVSRWENGQTYPDIELIPKIAAYFGVTTDELLVTKKDSVSEEEMKQKFFQNYLEITAETDSTKKLEHALRCFREMPAACEPERYEYAMIALNTLVHGNCMPREEALPLARELADILLNQKADRKFHNWALRKIFCYEEEDRLIDWEKYVGWYMTYHDLLELRYQYMGNWEEYNRQGQANLFTKLARLFGCGMFVKASDNEEETAQYIRESALFYLRLCDMFRESLDEDMDLFLKLRAEAYKQLAGANFRLGKREEGYEALEKSLDLYIKIITMPPDRELKCSHPMLNLISGCRMNWFEPNEKRDPLNQDSDYVNINDVFRGNEPSWFDPYRDEERFQECYKRFTGIKYQWYEE